MLTLAPWDMGTAGPPRPSVTTIGTTRSTEEGTHPVTIAVLDTGLPTQPQLALWHQANAVITGLNNFDVPDPLYRGGGDPDLDEVGCAGHGLFVAVVASRGTPGHVAIDSYRTSEFILSNAVSNDPRFRPGTLISTIEIVADLLRAMRNTPKKSSLIFNLSFGGYLVSTASGVGNVDFLHDTMRHIVRERPGTMFCAAAGNKAYFPLPTDPDFEDYNDGTRPIFPAAYTTTELSPNVVSVGALSSQSIADFSGRGRWVTTWTAGVGVPGEFVEGQWTNSVNGIATFPPLRPLADWSGTSFATPRVAAAIASRCATTGETPLVAWNTIYATLLGGLTWLNGAGATVAETGRILP
jgi:Subtilase family